MKQFNFRGIIRALREKYGFTQEEIAIFLGYSVSSISRIELGQQSPTHMSIETALQKLGEDSQLYLINFLDREDEKGYNAVQEMRRLVIERKKPELRALVKMLEGKVPFKSGLYLQYLLFCKAESAESITEQERLDILTSAIKITKKKFCLDEIGVYLLSQTEISVIGKMAETYALLGDNENAVQILYGVKKSMDTFYIEGKEKARLYPNTLYNLSVYLDQLERHEEAQKVCEEARDCAIKFNNTSVLPSILAAMSCHYFLLGDDHNSREFLLQAYYTARALKQFSLAKIIEDIAREEQGVDLTNIVAPNIPHTLPSVTDD